jgi:hypothetical protein
MRSAIKLLRHLPFFLAISAFGQKEPSVLIDTAPPPSGRFPANWYPADNDRTFTLTVAKNTPYTATLVLTDSQLDQATKEFVTCRTSVVQARDSAGRMHSETPYTGMESNSRGEMIPVHDVTVNDPVSHCNFRWMEPEVAFEKPTATVECMPRTIHYVNLNHWEFMWAQLVDIGSKLGDLPSGSSGSSESLGKRMFGEVEAEGVRTIATNTTQTGKIWTRVTEMWYAREIKELVQLNFDDDDVKNPQSKQTPYMQLTNIKRTEPDPKLFYPPQGYEIKPGQVR